MHAVPDACVSLFLDDKPVLHHDRLRVMSTVYHVLNIRTTALAGDLMTRSMLTEVKATTLSILRFLWHVDAPRLQFAVVAMHKNVGAMSNLSTRKPCQERIPASSYKVTI
jgi:hypothetical protein